ncbi:MAG: putative zinc-binding metallopeptidase [Verrucomicrobiales bacterium]|nr:putative zinc-binding metallopeptidase [Verrucomicrobiales bacterium]
MKIFSCPNCGSVAYFENTLCSACGVGLAYCPESNSLTFFGNSQAPENKVALCSNRQAGVCNWTIDSKVNSDLCIACSLNHVIPNLDEYHASDRWREIEQAKHRVVYSCLRFGLPIASKLSDPEGGLSFRFLSGESSSTGTVMTGHSNGIITLDIAEADPASREARRVQMGEPYRTLVGHFRHEIGHYYWDRLVSPDVEQLEQFRSLFGDERDDYGKSLKDHHESGPPKNWPSSFVTAYASVHPWEDFAESWAHYFHLVDLLETSMELHLEIDRDADSGLTWRLDRTYDPYSHPEFNQIFEDSKTLTLAVNSLNRSMGQPDLYPFVVPTPAVEKLEFVHRLTFKGNQEVAS